MTKRAVIKYKSPSMSSIRKYATFSKKKYIFFNMALVSVKKYIPDSKEIYNNEFISYLEEIYDDEFISDLEEVYDYKHMQDLEENYDNELIQGLQKIYDHKFIPALDEKYNDIIIEYLVPYDYYFTIKSIKNHTTYVLNFRIVFLLVHADIKQSLYNYIFYDWIDKSDLFEGNHKDYYYISAHLIRADK